jgi:hypothetical protein
MCHGIFPLYSPKPTSFWRPGTLNQAAHPTTDLGDVATVDTRRSGPFGGYSPLRPIFCDDIDLFVSFLWTGGWPKMKSGCILGVHFTRACSCGSRWIWTEFWASTSWVLCWAFLAMLRPRLFGEWASFSSYGFFIFLGPFMSISIYVLQNKEYTKTYGID